MKYALMVLAAAVATVSADGEDCQPIYNKCVASGRNEELCGCDLDACLGEDNQRSHEYCAKVSASVGLSSTTTAPPTVYTGVCNPAHAYPEQICTVIDGHLTLIPGTLSFGPSGGVPVPFTTTSAPVSAFTGACNPAHAYPEQICTLISGHLTLIPGTLSFGPSGGVPVPAKTTSAPSSAYTGACNPAHAYPEQICTLINGHLTLVPGSLTVGPSGGHPVLPTPVGSPYTTICTTPIYSAGNTTMVKPTASGTQPPSFTGAASVVDTLSGMVALVAGAVAYVL